MPLSQGQRGQINRATALPDGTIDPGRTAGTYPVEGWLFGIIPTIGGYVTTRFSADGNIAVNTTTSVHLFVGTITRTIYSNARGVAKSEPSKTGQAGRTKGRCLHSVRPRGSSEQDDSSGQMPCSQVEQLLDLRHRILDLGRVEDGVERKPAET